MKTTTTKEMPIFEVSQELAEQLKQFKNDINEKGYYDFSENNKKEIQKIFINRKNETGVDRTLFSIVAYLLSTQNFTIKEKLYRVILQEENNGDKSEWVYFFVRKDGMIDYTDLFRNVSVLKESEVPEQFKPFMKEGTDED